jgi:hypothetical protein
MPPASTSTLTATLRKSNQRLFDGRSSSSASSPTSPAQRHPGGVDHARKPAQRLPASSCRWTVTAAAAAGLPAPGTLFHSREAELIRGWKKKSKDPASAAVRALKLQPLTPEEMAALSAMEPGRASLGGVILTNVRDLAPPAPALETAPETENALPLSKRGVAMAMERRAQQLGRAAA